LNHTDQTKPDPTLEHDPFLRFFWHAKKLIAVAACLVGAAILGWRSLATSPPKKEQLAVIQGTVQNIREVKRTEDKTHPLLFIEGRPDPFFYLDWFPQPERIYQEVKAGDRVRLLSDTGTGNRWIWELEKDGRTIVAYQEVLGAVRANNRYDPYLALALGIAGVAALIPYLKSLRND
jgi:hypothetical protein